MSAQVEEVRRLAEEFEGCQKILLALGDENRQHLILEMMRIEDCGGVRVDRPSRLGSAIRWL